MSIIVMKKHKGREDTPRQGLICLEGLIRLCKFLYQNEIKEILHPNLNVEIK